MLRLAVLLLLLANAGYFAWSQGLLAPWGMAPAQQAEPHRLAQQIKPQALRIIAGAGAAGSDAAGAAPGPTAGECLLAGVFDEPQVGGLRRALESWPAGSWSLESAIEGEVRGHLLKLPTIDDALRPRLEDLKPALAGKVLRPCR